MLKNEYWKIIWKSYFISLYCYPFAEKGKKQKNTERFDLLKGEVLKHEFDHHLRVRDKELLPGNLVKIKEEDKKAKEKKK